MAIDLLTKTDIEVSAYLDTSIYHVGKGTDKEGNPFGILPTTDNPFDLLFDETNLIVTLKAGSFSVYGRQVIVDTDTEIFDAKKITVSGTHYCLVVCTVDLDDVTNQTATISILRGTNTYPTIDAANKANLFTRRAGRYTVPLRRFIYRTSSTPHFVKEGLVPQIIPFETKYAVENLRNMDSINGKWIMNLINQGTISGKQVPIFQKTADNTKAYENYKNMPNHNNLTPGYSIADEAETISGNDYNDFLTFKKDVQTFKIVYNDIVKEQEQSFVIHNINDYLAVRLIVEYNMIFDISYEFGYYEYPNYYTEPLFGPKVVEVRDYLEGTFSISQLKNGKQHFGYLKVPFEITGINQIKINKTVNPFFEDTQVYAPDYCYPQSSKEDQLISPQKQLVYDKAFGFEIITAGSPYATYGQVPSITKGSYIFGTFWFEISGTDLIIKFKGFYRRVDRYILDQNGNTRWCGIYYLPIITFLPSIKGTIDLIKKGVEW